MPIESINLFDKKEEFKPTADEMRVIADKMKDPEFAKLMHEYMETLNDPQTRKEEEEYLEQMEREAKEGGDYSFDFIFPKPVFAIELLETQKKKVIVNMCTSDKVDEYREETTNSRQSANWHVPVSVSKERPEQYNGAAYVVYDAVFNPKTMALAERSDKFVCFLVEIVVENINQGYKESFGFKFLRLPSSLRSVGQPQNQTVRREKGKAAFPLSDEPVSTRPVKPALSQAAKSVASAVASTKAASAAAQQNAAAPPPVPSSVPKFQIMHKGEIDLTDAWNWKVVDKRIGVPRELLVKLELPEAASAADLDIDVTEHYIDIGKSTKHPYHGTISLPFSVDATPVGAKFDKSKRILSLTLRVVPPVKPAEAIPPPELFPQIREQPAPIESAAAAPPVESAPVAEPAADVKTVPEQAAPLAEEKRGAEKLPAPVPIPAVTAADPPAEASEQPQAAPKPDLSSLSGDQDRMQQLMAKLAQARKEREEAEEAERLAEQGDKKPQSVDETTTAAAAANDEAVEVIDLRRKQQEWLDGVKQQQQAKDAEEERQSEEAARVADEEAKKKLKEARKKMEEERDAERAEAKMKEAMARLPLKSKYIFDIC